MSEGTRGRGLFRDARLDVFK